MKKILFLLSCALLFFSNAFLLVTPTLADTCTYYTQPDKCSTPPLGNTDAGKITGHTYLIKKCGTGSNATFSCIADCTKNPSTAHCPSSSSTTPPSGNTIITVVLALPGIGTTGGVPQHTQRNVTVELYGSDVASPGSAGTTPVQTTSGTVIYDSGNDNNAGYFVSTTPLSFANLPSGDYQILVKIPQFLYQLAINTTNTDNNHVFTLHANESTVLSPLTLAAGDVAVTGGQINHLNISDYNIFLGCYGSKASTSSCPVATSGPSGTNLADLNDDGQVDFVDLNIWLRSLSALQTANAVGCDQGDCQGD